MMHQPPVEVQQQQQTTVDPPKKTSKKSQTTREQVKVLLQAVDLIAHLADMDTSVYHQEPCFTRCSSHRPDHPNPSSSLSPAAFSSPSCECPFHIQQTLDQLQTVWKLEDTAIPKLTQAIHRLQSHNVTLQAELDQQCQETIRLQHHVTECSM